MEPITTNTAFLFIKPHACTAGVEDLVVETLSKFHIRVDRHDVMSTEQIEEENIIDRHYSVIARYAMQLSPDALSPQLSNDSLTSFAAAFRVEWGDAVARGTVLNAKQACSALNLTGAQLARKWALCTQRVKLAPGLYAGFFEEDGVVVLNGFYPSNREKFTAPGQKIHWYTVSWDEAALTWSDFRANVIGCTNPAEAPEGSLRRSIYERWQEFSLQDAPNVSDNGVHASAGPLEGLNERMVWLHATIRDDYFANSLLLRGVSASLLEKLLANPVVVINNRQGLVFDLLEDRQSSDVCAALKTLDDESRMIPLRNHAFLFIKPHAVNHSTKALVEATLALHDIRIDYEGEMTSEAISNRRIVDRHYSALARYAMEWQPSQILLDESAHQIFEAKFHVPWATAVKKMRVFNAVDAAKELGDISAKDLWVLWSAHERRLKLCPGLYVTYFDEQDLYVLNGFYLYNREKLMAKGKRIAWYCISWEESALSWKTFRASIVGATSPADAAEGSIRHLILQQWRDLGLAESPNTSDNGIHASASPLEALVERHVWLNQRIESDLLSRAAEGRGASSAFLQKWSSNPVVTLEGKTGAIFDLVEDINTTELIRLIRRAEEEAKHKVDTNTAFVFIKPHAVNNQVIDFVHATLRERNIRVVREGSLASEDIATRGLIDKHYSTIAKYAVEVTPDRIPLSQQAADAFFVKFRVRWEEALNEGRITNATDAAIQQGRLSPQELNARWVDAEKLKLAPGVYVGYFPLSSTFVVNGFYLLNREKYTTPGKRIHWFVVAWAESTLSWKSFRADVIGATNPLDAAPGSLRRSIMEQWRELGLSEPPTVSDNAIHASAGPIEGLNERSIWLMTDIVDDDFGVKLLFAGVPVDVVRTLLTNPTVTVANEDRSSSRTGAVFDLFEDAQSSEVVSELSTLYRSVEGTLTRNHALVFLKPHAVTPPVRQLVEQALDDAGITIDNSGSVSSERIYDEKLIDRHYTVIARLAMDTAPSRLELPDDALVKFETECGVAWSTAIAAGQVLNAKEAGSRFGLPALSKKWTEATIKVKLMPGLYIGRLPDDGVFVVNGFYPAIREKFTAPGKSIFFYTVSWDASRLSWKDFRANVIGATDPGKAAPGSIRRRILDEWHSLELSEAPTVSDNGVHASAGPLEALAERRVWLSSWDVASDPLAAPLTVLGMQAATLEYLVRNPTVSWKDKDAPAFDILEDFQTSDAAAAMMDMQCYLQHDKSVVLGTKATAVDGQEPEGEVDGDTVGALPAVSTFRPRNSAFVFIKPHAYTSGVFALLEVVFKEHRIRVDMEGDMISDEIYQRRIIDRHYATIHRYAEAWPASKVQLNEAARTVFQDTFHVSWQTAVSGHMVFNAADAAKMLNLTPEALGAKWRAAQTKARISPGLYVARFLEEDIYVMNAFYLENREKFIAPAARVHWYVVSFAEADLSWRDFRGKVVGPTNPELAAADTLRGTIYREYAALGLRAQPNTSDNGIHASAGPLEAFAERAIWLNTSIANDSFAKLALQRGSSVVVLQHWATNPVVSVDGKSGFAFDLLEDTQTTDAVKALVVAEKVRKAEPPINTAFLFIKPHACHRYVYGLVEAALRENKIDIVKEGDIYGDEIARNGLIDKHYQTISRYAMTTDASSLSVSEAAQAKFRDVYTISWSEAVRNGVVFNAVQACKVLGEISAEELNRRWSVYVNRVKLAPGLYVSEFTDEGIYVVNGFYLCNRNKFTVPTKYIHYYVVAWKEADLTWKDFREKIIGATDPAKAASSSLRSTIWRQWEGIGLEAEPDVSDNAIHASAGPFEGLAERCVWLGSLLEDDVYGKTLVTNGCNSELMSEWLQNNPTIILPSAMGATDDAATKDVSSGSSTVFDQLEDLQSSQVTAVLRAASKSYASPRKGTKKGSGGPQHNSGSADIDMDEVTEAARLKATNCAFLFIKPHACSKEVVALVDAVLQVNGMHVEVSGDIYSYHIEKRGLIDQHYATISTYAMEWKSTTHKLSPQQKELFKETFNGVEWDTAVGELRVLNAVDAAFSLGHLSPTQLARRWILSPKRVKLGAGLYVGWFEEDDLYVINGFYLLNREKYIAPEKKVHWYVVSWKEQNLSWKDFRARVIGATNPVEAEEGSLRRTILADWRNLALEQAPNVSDNGVHASASPLEGLRERMIWLGTPYDEDLFGRALDLAGCSRPMVLEQWCRNELVRIGDLTGPAFDLCEDKQSSEVVNILSDATAELMFAPMKHISITPKRKLFQASVRDRFINAVTEDELRELFLIYDPQDTGVIDRAAFRKEFEQMESFGQRMREQEVDKLFSRYDTLKNGKMPLEEFLLVMMARQRL